MASVVLDCITDKKKFAKPGLVDLLFYIVQLLIMFYVVLRRPRCLQLIRLKEN